MSSSKLVTIKTRVPAATVAALARLARKNERSAAAELRVALANHLADAPTAKDGRK